MNFDSKHDSQSSCQNRQNSSSDSQQSFTGQELIDKGLVRDGRVGVYESRPDHDSGPTVAEFATAQSRATHVHVGGPNGSYIAHVRFGDPSGIHMQSQQDSHEYLMDRRIEKLLAENAELRNRLENLSQQG